jgi:hypothetical protein
MNKKNIKLIILTLLVFHLVLEWIFMNNDIYYKPLIINDIFYFFLPTFVVLMSFYNLVSNNVSNKVILILIILVCIAISFLYWYKLSFFVGYK